MLSTCYTKTVRYSDIFYSGIFWCDHDTHEHHAHDQTSLYHQVISCVHPYKKERSIEELLTEELEYYTLFLANDYKTEEHSRSSEIPLECFLDFPRVLQLTNDIGVLRYAYIKFSFAISLLYSFLK